MKWAKTAGADSAEAFYVHGESLSVSQRLGAREKLEGSEGRDLRPARLHRPAPGLGLLDRFAPKALRTLVERAVDMARAVPEDPVCGIAPAELLAHDLARPRPRRQAPSAVGQALDAWPPKPRKPPARSRA